MKTLDQFKKDIEHRIRLSAGLDGYIGPNLQAVINLMAETLFAQQAEHQELINKVKETFNMHEPSDIPFWDTDDGQYGHGNGD